MALLMHVQISRLWKIVRCLAACVPASADWRRRPVREGNRETTERDTFRLECLAGGATQSSEHWIELLYFNNDVSSTVLNLNHHLSFNILFMYCSTPMC